MNPYHTNLLRRTAVALAAVAGLSISTYGEAAVITLTGTSGSSCSYSSMSVQPDGSFNVVCSGTSNPTPTPGSTDGGVFQFAQSAQTVSNIGGDNDLIVTRSSGTTGGATMTYTVSGAGCTNGVGTLSFADGVGSQNARVWGLQNGTCTVTLGNPSSTSGAPTLGPRLGSPATIAVTVGNGGGGTTTPQQPIDTSACPTGYAAPVDMANLSLGGIGNPLIAMARSNQTVSMKLPSVATGLQTGSIAFSESAGGAYTPQPVTLYISINKCPGYIDPDQNNRCNLVTSNGNYNSIAWIGKPAATLTAAKANAGGYCWAAESEGQWYVNARWTYSQCAFGVQTCGFAVQQNYGSF